MPWPWQKDGLLPLNRRWQTLRARGPKATLRVLIGALILAFVVAIVLSKPIPFVVDTTDYAIVTAFGKPTQVIASPGLGFRGAYESLRTLDRRLFVYVSPLNNQPMIDFLFGVLQALWQILEDASVYLLFGFLLAGVLAVCVPRRLLTRLVGTGRIRRSCGAR